MSCVGGMIVSKRLVACARTFAEKEADYSSQFTKKNRKEPQFFPIFIIQVFLESVIDAYAHPVLVGR